MTVTNLTPRERLIIPLDDCETAVSAIQLVHQLKPYAGTFKIGLDLITANLAHEISSYIKAVGAQVMYDGKFSDIPNTVGRAVKRVEEQGHALFTMHTNCGKASLEAAAKVKGKSKMLAVTVLTSLDEQDMHDLGYQITIPKDFKALPAPMTTTVFIKFATLAHAAGADGIVCSPQELQFAMQLDGVKDMLKVTPGAYPASAPKNDQKRTMTPTEALQAGADILVIGRPITQATDRVDTAKRVLDEIAKAKP